MVEIISLEDSPKYQAKVTKAMAVVPTFFGFDVHEVYFHGNAVILHKDERANFKTLEDAIAFIDMVGKEN
jgi:hypothetical protein